MWNIDRHVNVSMCHKASRGRWNRVEQVRWIHKLMQLVDFEGFPISMEMLWDARFTRLMHQTRPWTSLKISQWCLTFRKALANVLDRDANVDDGTDQLLSCCGPPTRGAAVCANAFYRYCIDCVCWPFVDLVYLVVDCLNLPLTIYDIFALRGLCVCVDRGLIRCWSPGLKLILHNMLEVERSQGYGTHIQGNTCGSEAASRTILHRMAPIHEHVLCPLSWQGDIASILLASPDRLGLGWCRSKLEDYTIQNTHCSCENRPMSGAWGLAIVGHAVLMWSDEVCRDVLMGRLFSRRTMLVSSLGNRISNKTR